jgi:hypothetical protein
LKLRLDVSRRLALETLDDQLANPRTLWHEPQIERTYVDHFQRDVPVEPCVYRWGSEVHDETKARE